MPLTGSNRKKQQIKFKTPSEGLKQATLCHRFGDYPAAFDCIESLLIQFPRDQVSILAYAYNLYQSIPHKNRYNLYVSRFFSFNIKPNYKVLDIGSGHLPFPAATHLADFSVEENMHGRAGIPFKHVLGKPVLHCDVENMPFKDKAFDFVYCSHVLEHVQDPISACKELSRVSKRGYIEAPSRAKDLFLSSAKISKHLWSVELTNNVLVFSEYTDREKQGLESNILMDMHIRPTSDREKAFSALIYLKADQVNTMVTWEKEIPCEVRRRKVFQVCSDIHKTTVSSRSGIELNQSKSSNSLKLLQVHTFYPQYLKQFYENHGDLSKKTFDQQMRALINDAFSAIHIIAPYIDTDPKFPYSAKLVVANCFQAQFRWLTENGIKPGRGISFFDILRWQIEEFDPDILYLTDPITFDSRFVRTLKKRPALVIGWRAADIPENTDWTEFDCILSSLQGIREAAVHIGAKSSVRFTPGFPAWIASEVAQIEPVVDVVFSGQYTATQHTTRNRLLSAISRASSDLARPFSVEFYLSGKPDPVPESMKAHLNKPVYGLQMHRILRKGRIAFDARGDIHFKNGTTQSVDVARHESANMRIFEATGTGTFLLTEHFDSLSQNFVIGKEIETFRDQDELLDKICYYLSHPHKRMEIALAGQKRCLTDHCMSKRLSEFDSIIRGLLKKASDTVSPSNLINCYDSVASNMKIASAQIDKSDFQAALEILSNLKAMQISHYDLDYLRAKAFLGLNQVPSCLEALKEEIRFFPSNKDAENLYMKLSGYRSICSTPVAHGNEFHDLYKTIAPYTMLGAERLMFLYRKAMEICLKGVPGNFVECGVAAGGSSALLAYVIKRYSRTPRVLYAFDSYEGMPNPSKEDTHKGVPAEKTGWGAGTCAAPVDNLVEICNRLGVMDFVKPVKGYFQQTLPNYKHEVGNIAFLHMDGDWYESTKAILENLYDKVIIEGYIQIDDYGHWDGCKKAVEEFLKNRNTSVNLNKIDYTGVWFEKSNGNSFTRLSGLLNLGCGSHFHPAWTNVDYHTSHPAIIAYDLRKGVPFEDESFEVVYHSHLLEHFSKHEASAFMKECYRVIKPRGIIRVVVPDLEMIIRCYSDLLKKCLDGNIEAQHQYEWIMLELFDQMVRNVSGGEMLSFLKQKPIPAEDFVVKRMGSEVSNLLPKIRRVACPTEYNNKENHTNVENIGRFRLLSGEIHQWMYDRYSLGKILKETGFQDIRVCAADESGIPAFTDYHLDVLGDGAVRKPDSLFMEARKPGSV